MSLQRRCMSNEDARFEVCPREAFCFICFCLDFEKRWIALPLTLKKKWRGTIPHCWLIGFDCYGRVMVITPLQLHCMVNGGRCTLPAQWTTQHNKMKRLVKYIQQMYDVSSVLSFLWEKNIFLILYDFIVIRQKWILIIILTDFALQHSLLLYIVSAS